jgi:hypothetical protein
MANFLVNNNFYQGTAVIGSTIISEPVYECRAVFSISASNQLEGSFWVVKNGQHLNSNLGTAEYLIRDALGATVGIVESGIVADANGLYRATPVGAEAIRDLTHYTVELKISAEGEERTGIVGITLGE